jgi:hypothetical protein
MIATRHCGLYKYNFLFVYMTKETNTMMTLCKEMKKAPGDCGDDCRLDVTHTKKCES